MRMELHTNLAALPKYLYVKLTHTITLAIPIDPKIPKSNDY